jgi:hypothetical protein
MTFREKYKEVRQVLLNDWDPLNVGNNPNLSDEYDSYVPQIIKLLQEGSTSADIEKYLEKVDVELGLALSREKRMQAANLLLTTTQ